METTIKITTLGIAFISGFSLSLTVFILIGFLVKGKINDYTNK